MGRLVASAVREPVEAAGETLKEICPNCGDGSGWHRWNGNWGACADCNDDMKKPKPPVCPKCDEVPAFCLCSLPPEMQGPPEEIGTGIYRLVDGEICGNEPDPPEM